MGWNSLQKWLGLLTLLQLVSVSHSTTAPSVLPTAAPTIYSKYKIAYYAGVYSLSGGYSGDGGPATSASLTGCSSGFQTTDGTFYVGDGNSHRVRKVVGGIITTFAGTGSNEYNGENIPATSATFKSPYGVWVNTLGAIYITERYGYRIKVVNNGIVSTFAGAF